jgi:hypothetical protein
MEVSGQLHSRGNSPRYPLYRRLDGPQNLSAYGIEEKNYQLPPEIEPMNPDRSAPSQSLYQLSYAGSFGAYKYYLKIIIPTFTYNTINIYKSEE